MRKRDRVQSLWKYCTSFLKNDWELKDYPLSITEREPDPKFEGTRQKQFRYSASILMWGLTGGGDSKSDAIKALAETFERANAERRKEGKPIPRPGTQVPAEFASQERINKHPELAEDFIRRIIDVEWAWISDESSLWDFHENQTNEALISKIKEIYCVDVSDIESANLCEILERIAAQGKNIPGGSSPSMR